MDETETLQVNTDYLKVLQEHVDSTYDHLQGFNPSAGIPYASYFPPRSFWTPEEKDIFFHGLSVYSRLRPDLIAADLPNKTVVDVCLFLDLLEEASKDEKGVHGRMAFAPALEASEKWTKWEEEQARRISINQPFWEDHRRHKERIRTTRALWPSCETSKRRKIADDSAHEDEKPHYDQMHAQWKKEDYLKDMSSLHLRSIDYILRESENQSNPLGGREEHIENKSDSEARPAVDPCIDPALLESATKQNHGVPLSPAIDDEDTVKDPGSLTPKSRRRYQKRLYMRRKRAALNGAAPSAAVSRLKPGRKTNKKVTIAHESNEKFTTNVSTQPGPTEERRLHDLSADTMSRQEGEGEDSSYLYGGKGEGSACGDNLDGASEAGQDINTAAGSASMVEQEAGGSTPHYKIVQDLTELGVNAFTLAEDGLGLFHLSNIGKLMGINASLDDLSASPDTGTCISATTIQLLHAHVVHFVADAVARSISMREQEQASKGHTKVWRMNSGQIPASTIREAVDLMGAQRDVKRHFRSLYARASGSSARSSKDGGSGDAENHDEGVDSEGGENEGKEDDSVDSNRESRLLSSHQELYGPIVRFVPFTTMSKHFPVSLKPGEADACLEMDDELMADEVEEGELLGELIEEEDTDKMDEILAQEAERELWSRVQLGTPATIPKDVPDLGGNSTHIAVSKPRRKWSSKCDTAIKGDGGKLRFAQPSRTGVVKSAVYVDDSD